MSILRNGAWLLAATILVGHAWAAQTPAAIPAEAFAVLPDHDPVISPDGKYFAVIREDKGRPATAIYEIGSSKPHIVIVSKDLLISDQLWVKDDVLLIYSRVNKTVGLWDVRSLVRTLVNATSVLVKDGKQVPVSADPTIIDLDLDDPENVFAQHNSAVVTMNVRTNKYAVSNIANKNGKIEPTMQWFFDGHGKLLARTAMAPKGPDNKSNDKAEQLLVPDGKNWRSVASYPVKSEVYAGLVGVAPDGTALIRRAGDKNLPKTIRSVDLADGRETVLMEDPRYDEYRLLTDNWTFRVLGVALARDRAEYRYFEPEMAAIHKGIAAAFPGLDAHVVSADRKRQKLIVEVQGPRTPVTYYLLDRTTHKAESIVATYPQLDEAMLGEVKLYPYKARDNVDIDAYLTLPPGKDPKNLPLVVMPHGGPDARDDMGFDWWSQFLANRGYAVLRPNYRGSSGYGTAFTEAGLKQWGLKMQDDISDGVRKAITDGIADPKRVCIVGASYGGYAALAGATFTPSLYACAVSFAGVSHLPQMLGQEEFKAGGEFQAYRFWLTRIGDPDKDSERLKATSPALQAYRVTAPILLIHSELDNTVSVGQSVTMYKALVRAGKKVEFIRIAGDDHYLSLASTRLTLLLAIERFLKANIGN